MRALYRFVDIVKEKDGGRYAIFATTKREFDLIWECLRAHFIVDAPGVHSFHEFKQWRFSNGCEIELYRYPDTDGRNERLRGKRFDDIYADEQRLREYLKTLYCRIPQAKADPVVLKPVFGL